MRRCDCGNFIDLKKAPKKGPFYGLYLYNCKACDSTLVEKTPMFPLYKATGKALKLMREFKNVTK